MASSSARAGLRCGQRPVALRRLGRHVVRQRRHLRTVRRRARCAPTPSGGTSDLYLALELHGALAGPPIIAAGAVWTVANPRREAVRPRPADRLSPLQRVTGHRRTLHDPVGRRRPPLRSSERHNLRPEPVISDDHVVADGGQPERRGPNNNGLRGCPVQLRPRPGLEGLQPATFTLDDGQSYIVQAKAMEAAASPAGRTRAARRPNDRSLYRATRRSQRSTTAAR